MGHGDLFEALQVRHGEGSPTPGGLGLEHSSRAAALANLEKTPWRRRFSTGPLKRREDLEIREEEGTHSWCIVGVCAYVPCVHTHVCMYIYVPVCVVCTCMHVWTLLRDWCN